MTTTSATLDALDTPLARVTVILGANGSGKSTLLRKAMGNASTICPGKKALYFEGGRAIGLITALQSGPPDSPMRADYSLAKRNYENASGGRLSDRVRHALIMHESKELAIKANHSDEVESWMLNGQSGPCPTRETPPLVRLFQRFHEIFPQIQIHVRHEATTKTLYAHKNSATYSISHLSDGEKQVFSILADFVDLGDAYGFIVVDEPELNLHPELAERLWDVIESEYPDNVFLYATHSLSFAMREQVGRVIVLSTIPENTIVLDGPADFSSLELREFLGSIPGIIAATKVVVTEGTDKSIDSVFYRWLLSDDLIEIMPAGDCEQVISVCRRDGIWSKIATKVSLVGVIDRDFRAASTTESLTLDFREAESYLAIPALVVAADKHLAIAQSRVTEDIVIDCILESIKNERHLIYANLVAAKCGIRLGVSVKKSVLKDCKDIESLLTELKQSSQEELNKATAALGDAAIDGLIKNIESELDQIIEARDWSAALRYIDGKKIANNMARLLGVRSAIDLMRSVAKNISPATIPQAQAISNAIAAKLAAEPRATNSNTT